MHVWTWVWGRAWTRAVVVFLVVVVGAIDKCDRIRDGTESANQYNQDNKNITDLLDSLLEGYDRDLRPGLGGPPIEVETNILIRSMGPVSEERMTFSMDCYFRQEWRDTRLAFTPLGNITQLRPSIKMLHNIWKPDTFFLNGQDSHLHTITYSNKLFRIESDGKVLYSQRLTIKSKCPMQLRKYPLDSQKCPLYIGSYGYATTDVKLEWKKGEPVKKYTDITMAQFSLTDVKHSNKTMGNNHGRRSILLVEIFMEREIGYYLLQIYLPCYLIVIISWVSFWINREATPARVTLGITTLLTTCTIGITGREGIPKVSYSTALDIYLLMCFSFVFAALVEYAGVNYFTKCGGVEIPPDEDEEEDASRPLLAAHGITVPGMQGAMSADTLTQTVENDPNKPLLKGRGKYGQNSQHTLTTDVNGHTMIQASSGRRKDGCWVMFMNCLKGNSKYRHFKSLTKTGSVSVSKIDSLARIIFPFSFTCLNILYWAGFLYYF